MLTGMSMTGVDHEVNADHSVRLKVLTQTKSSKTETTFAI